jgi:tetratricopeptide (TPR) repeat protein
MRSLLFLILIAPALAGEPAAARAEAGERLLDRGDIRGALAAYIEAAELDPGKQAYTVRALVLRRVERMRTLIESDDTSPRWRTAAITLHAFYLDEGLTDLALELDRKAHARLDSSGSAILLAETLLLLDRDEEVAKLLSARPRPALHERVLEGIALARLGRKEEAEKLDAAISVPGNAPSILLRDLARLKARLGAAEKALPLLRSSFEKTSANALDGARRRVRACSDFAALRSTPAFQEVLRTTSKIEEGCSGGSSCGSCPKRGECGQDG